MALSLASNTTDTLELFSITNKLEADVLKLSKIMLKDKTKQDLENDKLSEVIVKLEQSDMDQLSN